MTGPTRPENQIPQPDLQEIERRLAARTPENAARQAHLDAWRLGRDAMTIGGHHLAAGDLERAREFYAMATRHGAPNATSMVNTATALIDATTTPQIITTAAGTPLDTTPADTHAERDLATQRAEDLVHRIQQLEARAAQLEADNAEAETRANAIITMAEKNAAAILADTDSPRGPVHQDLTPNNVLRNPLGLPHLVDVGLGRRGFLLDAGEHIHHRWLESASNLLDLSTPLVQAIADAKRAWTSVSRSGYRQPTSCSGRQLITDDDVLAAVTLINRWMQHHVSAGRHAAIDHLSNLVNTASRSFPWSSQTRELLLDNAQSALLQNSLLLPHQTESGLLYPRDIIEQQQHNRQEAPAKGRQEWGTGTTSAHLTFLSNLS